MQLQTLNNISIEKITEAFNLSFSDYFVPINLTAGQLAGKMKSESVDLALSAGAFEGEELIGFILHGIDTINGQKTAYNAGTGVIPGQRGKKITNRLYAFILPKLKEAGIQRVQLEVISENEPAKAAYRKVGFTIKRELHCFKGLIKEPGAKNDRLIQQLNNHDWPLLKSFWDWQPSWQNSVTAVDNLLETNITLGLFAGDTLAGYLIYNPDSKRVQQFAVGKPYRRQGVATALFSYLASHFNAEISLINIDGNATGTLVFLQHTGLSPGVRQYEMEYAIG